MTWHLSCHCDGEGRYSAFSFQTGQALGCRVEKYDCAFNNVCYSVPFYFVQASDPCFILVFRNYKHLFLLVCKSSLTSAASSFCSEVVSYFQDQLSH